MTLEIRLARTEEYAEVGRITAAAYAADGLLHNDSDYVEELVDAASRAKAAELWVAVDGDDVLGSVTYCPPGSPYRELASDGEGEFRMLAVDAQHRRRGAAKALVRHCVSRSRAAGDRRIVICSLPQMRGAHRLYTDLGFVRDPTLDWWPIPQIELIGFGLDL